MRISMLSPVYNEQQHVAEMISSMQNQTHEGWELVFVDDGSTDATAEIISRFASTDSRIRLVSRGNKLGKVAAFNLAFEQSRGEVIGITGGDDVHPPGALALRVRALSGIPDSVPGSAFFKLRMFSADPKFDGLTLPRGSKGSRSGPSITMNRALAGMLFPIPANLVSEDIWLGEASEDIATRVIEDLHIVVNYRVHAGNSNPRHKSFTRMNESMHARAMAWRSLLDQESLELTEPKRRSLESKCRAEDFRYDGRTFRVLAVHRLPIVDRLAFASMSSATLFQVRSRFYKFFSGRRGR